MIRIRFQMKFSLRSIRLHELNWLAITEKAKKKLDKTVGHICLNIFHDMFCMLKCVNFTFNYIKGFFESNLFGLEYA